MQDLYVIISEDLADTDLKCVHRSVDIGSLTDWRSYE